MTLNDRLVGSKIDEKLAAEIKNAEILLGSNSTSETVRNLLKFGVEALKIVTSDQFKTEMQLETALAQVSTPELREKFLLRLIDEMGQGWIDRIKGDYRKQQLRQRATAMEEKDKVVLDKILKELQRLDRGTMHYISTPSLVEYKEQLHKASIEVHEYLALLAKEAVKASEQDENPDRVNKLAQLIPETIELALKERRLGLS